MRPPCHPVDASLGVGMLYEPGPHTLLFARVVVDGVGRRRSKSYVVRVVRLPWLFVGATLAAGSYVACHALLFDQDPRVVAHAQYVGAATVFGNKLQGTLLCLGNAFDVNVRADFWNTAFTHVQGADDWETHVRRAGAAPAIRALGYEGTIVVTDRSAR